MPSVARSAGTDSVFSPDGALFKCRFPLITSTGSATQNRVFAQGIQIVVENDLVAFHKKSGCVIVDVSTLNTYSSRVSACNKKIGRIGDTYGDNIIISGAPRVFSG